MPDLIALNLPGGPGFVDALRSIWDDGHAAFPLDPRLSDTSRRAMIDAIDPSEVRTPTGAQRRDGRPVASGDALVVATSGTSGNPRGVVLTHDALKHGAVATSRRLGVDPATDRWLACLPLSHMGGLGVIVRALATDTALEVHDGFDSAAVAASAEAGATLVSLVGGLLDRVVADTFRSILLGGGPTPPEVPPNAVVAYGMTETGGGVVYDGVPVDGVEMKIVDGEIHLKGPTLLRVYRDGVDPRDDSGWFATGDSGRLDPVGRLTVLGRRDDMIVTGGFNVWPAPVERIVRLHPDIADVAVIGRPDERWGHVVVAVVVPESSATPPDLEELRRFVGETLPDQMLPRRIEYATHLPHTSLGKLRRNLV